MAKTINIDAADLPEEDSEAKFREVLVPYEDEENGEVKAKKAFVLCCEPDGDEVSIPDVKMSIVKDSEDSKLKLDGDVESPGVYYAYCTNSSGEKGWLEGVTVDL